MSQLIHSDAAAETLDSSHASEPARAPRDAGADALDAPARLPAELEHAIASGALEGLLLDVQGAGLMMDDDGLFFGETPIESEIPTGFTPSPGDPVRMSTLRETLGVNATQPPPAPRQSPKVVNAAPPSLPEIRLQPSRPSNRTPTIRPSVNPTGSTQPMQSPPARRRVAAPALWMAVLGGLAGFATAIIAGWLVLALV